MNEEAEKRNGRATEWRSVIGTVCQENDTIGRHVWRKELQMVSYIISMKYSKADDTTKIETFGSQFSNSK